MTASPGFAEFLREHLAPVGGVAMRRMFGSTGLFRDGLLFALVSRDTLYLRVDSQNQPAFEEAGPPEPMRYTRQGKLRELPYWRVPDQLLDEPDTLRDWARAAIAASRRVAAERKPRKRQAAPAT